MTAGVQTPSRPPGTPRPPGPAPRSAAWDTSQPVLGLLGALTVIAGSSSLLVPLEGTVWIGPLLQVIGVIWLVGVGARLAGSPAPITVLIQVAGACLTITALFSTRGWYGFIPNKEVLDQLGGLLSEAWNQILVTAPPAPATPELSFLIVLTVGMTALITDFLVVEARAAALVALPLLCLYSVPASIVEDMLPWWTFALPAAMYILLLAASGHRGTVTSGRTRIGVAVTAVVAASLAISVALVAADQVDSVGTAGRLPRNEQSGSNVGLSPFTSLHGDLNRRNPVDYLRISGTDSGDYLRTIGLETWTNGEGWSLGELSASGASAAGDLTVPPLSDASNNDLEQISIEVSNYRDRFLPMFAGTQSLAGLADGWSLDGATRTVYRDESIRPGNYTMLASFSPPGEDVLNRDQVSTDPALLAVGNLPNSVADTAQRVAGAGDTAYRKAMLLQDWFTDPANGFRYSLQVPTGNSGDALVDFLELKQGYCEQYASAMAVMLRSLGIPARVAIGFTGGEEQPDGDVLITSHEAHAWVEVRFEGAGWVRFDPTPLGQAGGAGQDPTESSDSEETTDESTETSTTSSTVTTTTTTTSTPTVTVPGQSTVNAGGADTADGADTGSGEVLRIVGWVLLGLLVLALIGLVVALPGWLRRRRRKQRTVVIRQGGTAAAPAAWAELEDVAVDHGLTFEAHLSVRSAANRLARVGQLGDQAREGLRTITLAVERSWYAPAGPDVPAPDAVPPADPGVQADLVAAVATIEQELSRSLPLTRWDRLLPRSVRPGNSVTNRPV